MQRILHSVEGNRQRLDGGAMFGNAPRALWERWASPDERNRIELACRALLVVERDGDRERRILFETGIGAFFDPRMRDRFGVEPEGHVLLENLAALGLSDADIDVVVLSHLHFDHAGGLLTAWSPDSAPRLLFPNAIYVVGSRAWERACHPHPRDRASFIPELQGLLSASRRLEVVGGEDAGAILGPGYRFHLSDGHTPGMLLTEIPGELGPVLFAGDLVPGRAWVHRSITMGYDRFAELVIDEKERILGDLVERHGRLFFTHDPEVALARLTRDDKGRFGSASPLASLDGVPA